MKHEVGLRGGANSSAVTPRGNTIMRPTTVIIVTLLIMLTAAAHAQGTPPRDGYLDGAGGHLYYEECGAGRALILLHDGLLHSVVWDDV